LVSNIRARVDIARNNLETSPLNRTLNETPFGPEEFSFTIVSAEDNYVES
jgi:hypothetical protein